MPTYFKSRTGVVRFVSEKLLSLKPNSVWTMITLPDTSGGYSVITVTEELSEDTVPPQRSLKLRTNTSPKNTPDGQSLQGRKYGRNGNALAQRDAGSYLRVVNIYRWVSGSHRINLFNSNEGDMKYSEAVVWFFLGALSMAVVLYMVGVHYQT